MYKLSTLIVKYMEGSLGDKLYKYCYCSYRHDNKYFNNDTYINKTIDVGNYF